ncbi:ATP-binding protein [Psychrobacter vallis]|uniref:ATP-binding protein n=1 Tax=Psychrobacter vallis TaxID=248451 RepID=UPI001918AE54|nr:ATP-binding protein [Psychrobacter vallis]
MAYKSDNRRLSLLWRTTLVLSLCVLIAQAFLYTWIQRSVNHHFEQMDSEILTHAAFNLRQHMTDITSDDQRATRSFNQLNFPTYQSPSLESFRMGYEVKTVITNDQGQVIDSQPEGFVDTFNDNRLVKRLWQQHRDQPFDLPLNNRHFRAIIIEHSHYLALIALPIDVHHQYLEQFNRDLILILIAITFILVSVAAFSVYLGFAPLSTISHKMTRINAEQLDDRIVVADMPSELRPLADAYNAMMDKLEHNFDALSQFSDDIAHELRTPLATLNTQTQVMLSKPRDRQEYIEQLHHQHSTLEQLSTLINNMLLLAKTQKGLYSSRLNLVDTESLITKLIDYYKIIAEDRSISFEKKGNFDALLGDESLLQILFANLISNAVYYAASDSVITIVATGVSASIAKDSTNALTDTPKQPSLIITITNRLHEPLTQTQAAKLFERFYRHDKTNSQHLGTGLGLSIVQAIAHAHHGKVSITIKDECYFQVKILL